MQKTSIEWVRNPDGSPGYTFNPITGCLNNCSYCYARKLANGRLRSRYLANQNTAPLVGNVLLPNLGFVEMNPFYPRFWAKRLYEPKHTKGNKGVFVCDMSDLFGIGIPQDWTRYVMVNIVLSPQHRFYLLTKQPQNLVKWSPFPDNCWVGVTATDHDGFLRAITGLQAIEATVKFISFEPLLKEIPFQSQAFYYAGINWVIIGAQTKPYKPPKWEWVSEIIDACVQAKIPYFLKDNLEPIVPKVFGGDGELIQELPK